MGPWYETMFENFSKNYDQECYTQGTLGECDFIESEIGHDKEIRILDIGCGTGRHAVELARRGYTVVGVDLSEAQLRRAREKAEKAQVAVDFQRQDARSLTFNQEFDLVIMLCEGGFSLMETDEMNFLILQNAANALKPSGKLIFTTLNGLFPLFHSVKDFINAEAAREGGACVMKSAFDLMTFRDHNTTCMEDDDGVKHEIECNERCYVPSEITWLLKSLRFRQIDIHGAHLGAFSRQDPLTTEDFEMLIIATK